MPVEQRTSLPFADDFPVNVQIRIRPLEREYVLEIQADWGKWYRVRIGLKQNDIADLNAELVQTIERAAGNFDEATVDPATSQETISQLAEKGNFAFKSIFADSAMRESISTILKPGTTIQVTSEEFLLPWELLYDGPIGFDADASRFWGMQHVISRALIQDNRPGDNVSPIIRVTRPCVGLVACGDLTHVSKQEIPALKRLQEQNQLVLLPLRSLDPKKHQVELEELGRFLSGNLEIAHLACHAFEGKPLSQSYLLISDQFPITMQDFKVHDLELKHNPFVLLNACRTGTMNPLSTSNWAALFWERGARGVLASEFRVPDAFAAAFIEQVYSQLLSGIPIGTSLLTARQYFWNEQRNPLGLAYALYSSPSIRIER